MELGERIGRLSTTMSRLAAFGFSGAWAVRVGGEITAGAHGWADRTTGVPNTRRTIFNTGSVTKQFTAMALGRAVDEGRLSFDDDVSRWVPEWPVAGTTLHHLLTHTSGLEVDVGDDFEMIDRAEFLRRVVAAPPETAPGERFHYSNAGYGVLAVVVEAVFDQTWEQVLGGLWEEAEMSSTGYRAERDGPVAHWYNGDVDEGRSIDRPFPSWTVIGNGEVLSTVDDMVAWERAVRDGLVSDAVMERVTTPAIRNYAYAHAIDDTPLGRLAHHDGASFYGSSASYGRYLDTDVAFVAFANVSYDRLPMCRSILPVVRRLVETGEAPEIPDIDGVGLDGWEGVWRGDGVSAVVTDSPLVGSVSFTGPGAGRVAVGVTDDALVDLTRTIVDEASAGSTNTLADVITEPDRRLPVVGPSLLREVATSRRWSVVGPTPSEFIVGSTNVFAMGADGTSMVFVWDGTDLVGFAPMGEMDAASFRVVAVGDDEAVAHHLGWSRTLRLSRAGDTLTVEDGTTAATFRR